MKNKKLVKYKNALDKDNFPINSKGEQIAIQDKDGNIKFLLKSNFLATFKENSHITFNPNDKLSVNRSLDVLVNVLTNDFIKHLNNALIIDLSDEVKIKNNIRCKPLKISTITMYFNWIDNWLKYFSNVFNFEFKALFYSKYKEKVKNHILNLESKIYETNTPKNHIKYFKKWIKETDKNIKLESLKITNNVNKEEQNENLNNNLPNIFKTTETYNNFKTYTKRYIIDRYTDYSYLFQRMKKENLIDYTRHLDFMKWLNENDFISENVLNEFNSKGNFKSLEKSYSAHRENNFNNTFNL